MGIRCESFFTGIPVAQVLNKCVDFMITVVDLIYMDFLKTFDKVDHDFFY